MKRKSNLVVILALILTACSALAGCSVGGGQKDPITVIQNAYGGEQFKISFSSKELDAPLADVYYTASGIPKLPSPEKVGFVFAGWYFDSALTRPYEDDALYLYMKNVTLYPKWMREEISVNGTYDIEFDAAIVEGSVAAGALAEAYGGYGNFPTDIVAAETYIEKTDSGLFLKLHYDCHTTVPYGSLTVYTVNVAAESASNAYVGDMIRAETDTVKTAFINIDGMDLAETLYLRVSWMNWITPNLTAEERAQTATSYIVAFRITRFIGFGRPFINPNAPLDDGYYLIKTYFRGGDGTETMLEGFNPVYAYIIADGGAYTLIKPFSPYVMVADTGAVSKEDYYHLLTIFYRIYTAYKLTNDSAGAYSGVTYEFNADTGKCFYTLDLGNRLAGDLFLWSHTTGFMQMAAGYGLSSKRVLLQYDQILKLQSIDYEPLSGDAFLYSDKHNAASGTAGMQAATIEEYGLAASDVNFFFSLNGLGDIADLGLDTVGTKMYSTKITSTPTPETASVPATALESVPVFNRVSQVYGYDARNADLCADASLMAGSARRAKYAVRIGKSLRAGDAVNLTDLYAEKVDKNADLGLVSWQGYRMTENAVDFSKPVSLAKTFTFGESVAVLFTSKYDDGVKTSLVELAEYSAPVVTVDPDTYDPDATYASNAFVPMPAVTYTWMGKEGVFIDDYYADGILNVDLTRVAIGAVNDDTGLVLFRRIAKTDEPLEFRMTTSATSSLMRVMYEMRNYYGEIERFYLDFHKPTESSPTPGGSFPTSYEITEGAADGKYVTPTSHSVSYTRVNDELVRSRIASVAGIQILPSGAELSAAVGQKYYLHLGAVTSPLNLSSYTVKTRAESKTVNAASMSPEQVAADFAALIGGDDYAYLSFVYASGADTYTAAYLYNMRFDGRKTFQLAPYEKYYEKNTYVFAAPVITDRDGVVIGAGTLAIGFRRNNTYVASPGTDATVQQDSGSISVTFHNSVSFILTCSATLRFDEFGGRVFANDKAGTSFSVSEPVVAYSLAGDVTITYVTDAAHPFTDGTTEKTVTYDLASSVLTIDKLQFAPTPDVLFAWSKFEGAAPQDYSANFLSGTGIANYARAFNAASATLYAIWDEGITVTAHLWQGAPVAKKVYLTRTTSATSVDAYGNLTYRAAVYSVNLTSFDAVAPAGYVLVGWSGGVFANGFSAQTAGTFTADGDCSVTAVFKKLLTVRYEIDSDMSGTHFANDRNIVEDSVLAASLADPGARMNVACKAAGFEFKYWAVRTGDGLIPFDIYADALDAEWADANAVVTLVAVFGEIGGA